ncbi:MAG: hypothetical protein AAGG80_01240 [Pseudomonadota bacterium]
MVNAGGTFATSRVFPEADNEHLLLTNPVIFTDTILEFVNIHIVIRQVLESTQDNPQISFPFDLPFSEVQHRSVHKRLVEEIKAKLAAELGTDRSQFSTYMQELAKYFELVLELLSLDISDIAASEALRQKIQYQAEILQTETNFLKKQQAVHSDQPSVEVALAEQLQPFSPEVTGEIAQGRELKLLLKNQVSNSVGVKKPDAKEQNSTKMRLVKRAQAVGAYGFTGIANTFHLYFEISKKEPVMHEFFFEFPELDELQELDKDPSKLESQKKNVVINEFLLEKDPRTENLLTCIGCGSEPANEKLVSMITMKWRLNAFADASKEIFAGNDILKDPNNLESKIKALQTELKETAKHLTATASERNQRSQQEVDVLEGKIYHLQLRINLILRKLERKVTSNLQKELENLKEEKQKAEEFLEKFKESIQPQTLEQKAFQDNLRKQIKYWRGVIYGLKLTGASEEEIEEVREKINQLKFVTDNPTSQHYLQLSAQLHYLEEVQQARQMQTEFFQQLEFSFEPVLQELLRNTVESNLQKVEKMQDEFTKTPKENLLQWHHELQQITEFADAAEKLLNEQLPAYKAELKALESSNAFLRDPKLEEEIAISLNRIASVENKKKELLQQLNNFKKTTQELQPQVEKKLPVIAKAKLKMNPSSQDKFSENLTMAGWKPTNKHQTKFKHIVTKDEVEIRDGFFTGSNNKNLAATISYVNLRFQKITKYVEKLNQRLKKGELYQDLAEEFIKNMSEHFQKYPLAINLNEKSWSDNGIFTVCVFIMEIRNQLDVLGKRFDTNVQEVLERLITDSIIMPQFECAGVSIDTDTVKKLIVNPKADEKEITTAIKQNIETKIPSSIKITA